MRLRISPLWLDGVKRYRNLVHEIVIILSWVRPVWSVLNRLWNNLKSARPVAFWEREFPVHRSWLRISPTCSYTCAYLFRNIWCSYSHKNLSMPFGVYLFAPAQNKVKKARLNWHLTSCIGTNSTKASSAIFICFHLPQQSLYRPIASVR